MQIESDAYAMIAQLKEFKLQAEKHLFSIPVIDQVYISTQNLSLKENEKRMNMLQFHSWIDWGQQGIW